jgi:hypothetical protein
MLARGVEWLAEQQDMLYAQDHWALLLAFQAMDAAGKDGTVKHVTSGINPQGCTVTSFKQPSSEELDHDFRWRYVRNMPARGQIGIFDRPYHFLFHISRAEQMRRFMERLARAPGVGGGIVAAVTGRFAIAAFSPRLNAIGNRVLSLNAIRYIAGELGVGVFGPNPG